MARSSNKMSLKDLFSTNFKDLSTKSKFKKYASESLMEKFNSMLPQSNVMINAQYNNRFDVLDSQGGTNTPSLKTSNSDNSSPKRIHLNPYGNNLMNSVMPGSNLCNPQSINYKNILPNQFGQQDQSSKLQVLIEAMGEIVRSLSSLQDNLHSDMTDIEKISIEFFTKMQADLTVLLTHFSDVLKDITETIEQAKGTNYSEAIKLVCKETMESELLQLRDQMITQIDAMLERHTFDFQQNIDSHVNEFAKSQDFDKLSQDINVHIDVNNQSLVNTMVLALNENTSKNDNILKNNLSDFMKNVNYHLCSVFNNINYKMDQNFLILEKKLCNYIDASLSRQVADKDKNIPLNSTDFILIRPDSVKNTNIYNHIQNNTKLLGQSQQGKSCELQSNSIKLNEKVIQDNSIKLQFDQTNKLAIEKNYVINLDDSDSSDDIFIIYENNEESYNFNDNDKKKEFSRKKQKNTDFIKRKNVSRKREATSPALSDIFPYMK